MKLFLGIFFTLFSLQITAQVAGTVFKDYNINGVQNTTTSLTEVGLSGVTVKAYNASNALLGSGTTASDGTYLIAGITGKIRLEFDVPAPFYATKGAISNTVTQFLTVPSGGLTNVNLGVNSPADYCPGTPNVIVACYVSGDPIPTGTGVSGTYDALVSFPYGIADQSTTAPTHLAIASEIGPVWGAAYQRESKKLFMGALLKRHVGLTSAGLGGVFTSDFSGSVTAPVNSLYVDLENLGIDLGQSLLGTRSLPSTPTSSSNDSAAFDLVGKVGLGGMSISDDGTALYTVNLYENKLMKITIGTPAKAGASIVSSDITQISLPTPNCTGGAARPFAIKYYQNKVYVGMVCTGESGGTLSDMFAYVYVFDPETGTFNTTPLVSFSLDYAKGKVHTLETPAKWNPWISDFTSMYVGASSAAGQRTMLPQPMLSDIDFIDDGDLVLTFMDRAGHQLGYKQRGTTGTTSTFNGYIGGDVLRLRNISGVWTLENNGVVGTGPTASTGCGVGNNQGPGNGEFFCNDQFTGILTSGQPPVEIHQETIQGSTFTISGKKEILTTVMDPLSTWSGGTSWFSTDNGQTAKRYQIYSTTGDGGVTFGKAGGLGTVELACAPQPIEIGNRVWKDSNKDGIQGADEEPLVGVTVKLYDATGTTVLGSTTTDTDGRYFFSSDAGTDATGIAYNVSINPFTNYQIKVTSIGTDPSVAGIHLVDVTTALGETSGAVNSNTTMTNNDAFLVSGIPTISLKTAGSGQNIHSYDIGFICVPPTVGTPVATAATCTGLVANNDATIAISGIVGGDKYSYGTDTTSFTYASATALSGSTINILGLTNPSAATTYYIRVYNALDACFTTVQVVLTPTSCACTPPVVGTPLATKVTCNGATANSDGKIDIAGISGGDKYSYGTDTLAFSYAAATSFSGSTINISGLANPNVPTTYYIRIYNGRDVCYKTVQVILEPMLCFTCPNTTYQLCPGESYTLSTSIGATGIQWFKNGVEIALPEGAANSLLVTSIGTYSYTSLSSGGICKDSTCCPVVIVAGTNCCIKPTLGTLTATPSTCIGSNASNDASLYLSSITNGLSYSYGTDTSAFSYSSAISFTGSNLTIQGIANPTAPTTYYVRVYNGSANCFTDIQVVLNSTVCNTPCNSPNCLGIQLKKN